MRDDEGEDPFDHFFREVERMMNDMIGDDIDDPTGFGEDTHVDVQEAPDEVRVVADLPGMTKDDLSLQCDGDVLTISAKSDRRQFDERVHLPASVDERTAHATFNNGVLEVVLEKTGSSANISLE